MSTESQTNPLERVGNNLSVESGLPYENGQGSILRVASQDDAEMLEELGLTEASDTTDSLPDEASVDSFFPGVSNGDFTEVDQCLVKANSNGDLVAFLEKSDDGTGPPSRPDACPANESYQVDLFGLLEKPSDHSGATFDLDAYLAKESSQVDQFCLIPEKPSDDAGANFELNACPAKESPQISLFRLPERSNDNARVPSELDACLAKESSQADLVDLSNCELMEVDCASSDYLDDLMQIVKQEQEEKQSAEELFSFSLPATLSGLALSPSTPAEALDQSATAPLLPSLPVLDRQQKQQPPPQYRLVACQPLLNSFETMSEVADSREEEEEAATAAKSKSKPPAIRRRANATSSNSSGRGSRCSSDQHEKSYAAMCQKNRIFDSGAKARYRMEQQLERDVIVHSIVGYVKQCLDPERDRVHRFLMVMLVDGQLERGPYWRFFQDAVYFCDARKVRLTDDPGHMFHIRQSAYVGLLWGCYKGNECFDYATLGDAIKSVKSKPNGERYFVDPDFGSLVGKPKRLFQFGESAFDEVCRYLALCRGTEL